MSHISKSYFQHFKGQIKNIVECLVLQLTESGALLDQNTQNVIESYLVKILDKLDQSCQEGQQKSSQNKGKKQLPETQIEESTNNKFKEHILIKQTIKSQNFDSQLEQNNLDQQNFEEQNQDDDYLQKYKFVDYTSRYNHVIQDNIPTCRQFCVNNLLQLKKSQSKDTYTQKNLQLQEKKRLKDAHLKKSQNNQYRLRPLTQYSKISQTNVSSICQSQSRKRKYDFNINNDMTQVIENKQNTMLNFTQKNHKYNLLTKSSIYILKLNSPKGKLFQAKDIKRKIFR